MDGMPEFEGPLREYVQHLTEAGFNEEQIGQAAAALGAFTGTTYAAIQQEIYQTIDRMGMAASQAFGADGEEMQDWYKGFLSGVIVSGQVALQGDEFTAMIISTGLLLKLRRGMDQMLSTPEDQLPPAVAAMLKMVMSGQDPTPEMIREATEQWVDL